MIVEIESASNGRTPVRSSYSTTPSEKRSLLPSRSFPWICSGDMYDGVPSSTPDWVRPALGFFASPKSVTLRLPSSCTMRFAGLMSRWITFAWCA